MSVEMLVRRFTTVFGVPSHVEDPKEFTKEFVHAIRGFSPDAYVKASDVLIRSHEPTNLKPWPSMAATRQAVHDAQEALPKGEPKEKDQKWTRSVLQRADDLIQSDLGRQAAEEGWSLSLWDFCREKGRLPDGYEISACKQITREFDEAYALTVNTSGTLAKQMKELGEMMLARRYQKADLAYGVISNRRELRKEMELTGLRANTVEGAEQVRGKVAAQGPDA